MLNGKNVSVTTPFVSHSINDKIVEEVRLDSVMCHLEGDEDIIGASVIENRGVFRHECGFVDGSAIGSSACLGCEFVQVGAILDERDFFYAGV